MFYHFVTCPLRLRHVQDFSCTAPQSEERQWKPCFRYRDRPNELAAGVEHEQPRPVPLPHVLKPLPEQPPAVLPAAGILVGGRPVDALTGSCSIERPRRP